MYHLKNEHKCPVFEWLKQDGCHNHLKTGSDIIPARLEQKQTVFYDLFMYTTVLANGLLKFEWSGIRMPGTS